MPFAGQIRDGAALPAQRPARVRVGRSLLRMSEDVMREGRENARGPADMSVYFSFLVTIADKQIGRYARCESWCPGVLGMLALSQADDIITRQCLGIAL